MGGKRGGKRGGHAGAAPRHGPAHAAAHTASDARPARTCPTSALSREDLPTLGRPTMATAGQHGGRQAGGARQHVCGQARRSSTGHRFHSRLCLPRYGHQPASQAQVQAPFTHVTAHLMTPAGRRPLPATAAPTAPRSASPSAHRCLREAWKGPKSQTRGPPRPWTGQLERLVGRAAAQLAVASHVATPPRTRTADGGHGKGLQPGAPKFCCLQVRLARVLALVDSQHDCARVGQCGCVLVGGESRRDGGRGKRDGG